MSDRETAEKLKARIDNWQSYIGQPSAVVTVRQDTAKEPEQGDLETTLARFESKIENLQAAVDQEREQTRRLAERLAREQAMNNMHAQPPIDVTARGVHTNGYTNGHNSTYRRARAARPAYAPSQHIYEQERRANIALWAVMVVLIAGVGAILAVLSTR